MFWIEGLRRTTTVHASVLATTYPLMLVVVLSLGGVHITLLEKIGVVVAFIGLGITSFAASNPSLVMQLMAMSGGVSSWASTGTMDDSRLYLLGDTLCLLSAVCETSVILNRQQTRVYVPLFTYTAATTAVVAIVASMFALLFGGRVFCLQDTCLFGWLAPAWAPYVLAYSFVSVSMFVCFNYALSFFSPLLFSAITLVDPACTALVSWALEIESLPDVYTWLGGLTVIGGIALVLYGESYREKLQQQERQGRHLVGGVEFGSIPDLRRVGSGLGSGIGVEGNGSSPRTELESPGSDEREKASAGSPVSIMLSPKRGEEGWTWRNAGRSDTRRPHLWRRFSSGLNTLLAGTGRARTAGYGVIGGAAGDRNWGRGWSRGSAGRSAETSTGAGVGQGTGTGTGRVSNTTWVGPADSEQDKDQDKAEEKGKGGDGESNGDDEGGYFYYQRGALWPQELATV